jgi:hypothetical protein
VLIAHGGRRRCRALGVSTGDRGSIFAAASVSPGDELSIGVDGPAGSAGSAGSATTSGAARTVSIGDGAVAAPAASSSSSASSTTSGRRQLHRCAVEPEHAPDRLEERRATRRRHVLERRPEERAHCLLHVFELE